MKQEYITCSICGYTFDPTRHASCQHCPLNKNCTLLCCPQCGFEMINIQQSKLVRMLTRWLPKNKENPSHNVSTLAGISPGQQAKVIGFTSLIPADRRAYLQSYGLTPGRLIRVVQHSPVTIIQVEHTELALEREMAREIQVDIP